MLLYIGTSTSQKNQGIHTLRLNLKDGSLSRPELAIETPNPSFLVVTPEHRVYCCNEMSKFNAQPTGMVSAFSADAATARLTLINQQSSGGAGPAHVSLDASGRTLFVANYSGGSVASVAIDPATGALGELKSIIQHTGRGPTKRQTSPHAHAIAADPSGKFVLATDLGIDKLVVYALDQGKLIPQPSQDATLAPGSGPRSFVFSKDGRFVYVIDELDNTLVVLSWDASAGALRIVQTLSSLPPAFTGTSWAATIARHPTGRFLYASNRGADGIACFSVDQDSGKLTFVDQTPVGKVPRHFAIDPSGQYLVCANQGSDSLMVFRIDPKTGALTATGGPAAIPKPMCVQFAGW